MEWLQDFEWPSIAGSTLVGAFGWWFGDWNRRRIECATLVREVADRYVAEMRHSAIVDDASCVAAMQRAGVALLDQRPHWIIPMWGRTPLVAAFFNRVCRLGFPDPWRLSELGVHMTPAQLPSFLFNASMAGEVFPDRKALYEYLVHEIIDERDGMPIRVRMAQGSCEMVSK